MLGFISNNSHKKRKIVWKHGPNSSFYALMLKTKQYWNPFFFIVHQNVNKPNNKTPKIAYEPMFLPFYVIIISFFFFFCQDANVIGSDRATIGCNLSKKHKMQM